MYIPPEKQLRRFRIATGKRFFSKRFDFFIEKTGMQRYPMSIVANYKQEKKRQEQKKKKRRKSGVVQRKERNQNILNFSYFCHS